ncbi:MAG: histidine phosphatase family protein [Janthinobacterium lividum]
MPDLVLRRHGESTTNLANVFTGWTDVDFTHQGVAVAHRAGQLLRQHGFHFDVGYTCGLKRPLKTMDIVLEELDLHACADTRRCFCLARLRTDS